MARRRFCEGCGAALERGARFCTGCGRAAEAAPEGRRCACGAALEADARFCVSCGRPVGGSGPREGARPPAARPAEAETPRPPRPAETDRAPARVPRPRTDALSSYEFGEAEGGRGAEAPTPPVGVSPPRVVWRTPEPSGTIQEAGRPEPGARTSPLIEPLPEPPRQPVAAPSEAPRRVAPPRPSPAPAPERPLPAEPEGPPPGRRWLLASALTLFIVAVLLGGLWALYRFVLSRDSEPPPAAEAPAAPPAAPSAAAAPEAPAPLPAVSQGPRFGGAQRVVSGSPPGLAQPTLLAFDPVGSGLAVVHPALVDLVVWPLGGGGTPRRLGIPEGVASALTPSPDGTRLALAGSLPAPGLRVWDVQTGLEVFSASLPADPVALSFRPDGSLVVLAGIAVFEVDPGQGSVRELSRPEGFVPLDPRRESASLSPDGSRLARAGGGIVSLWELPAGRLLSSRAAGPGSERPPVAFRRDGRYLAVGEGRLVVVREATTLRVERSLEGQAGEVAAVAWSDDGRSVVASGGGEVRLWDVVAARLLDRVPAAGETAVALSRDGGWVAIAGGGDVNLFPVR
ncbi:MAG: hypothetical protein EDX89_08385 [Acidobacteria bacterium]|nr:MAG: hypothetical protein EDX89_08385 [Acidobacteriota bacterium]